MAIEKWFNPVFSSNPYGVVVDANGTPTSATELNSAQLVRKFNTDPAGYMKLNGGTGYELDELLQMVGRKQTRRESIA